MTMMGAGKSVPEHMLTYDISSMFEMGTGKVLSQEVAGAAGKTIADELLYLTPPMVMQVAQLHQQWQAH
jgi:hypothetical protein